MTANIHPATCARCGLRVAPGAGRIERTRNQLHRWRTVHDTCPAAQQQVSLAPRSPEPLQTEEPRS